MGDPALAARTGQAGKERALTLFSWESIAERHLALYVAGPGPASTRRL
jgi:hypothetical protein